MRSPEDVVLLALLADLNAGLYSVRDADKALKIALRMTHEVFGSQSACIAVVPPGSSQAALQIAIGPEDEWDRDLLAAFIGGRRPKLDTRTILAPLERRDRAWAALGLRWSEPSFDVESMRSLVRVTETISRLVQRIDRERITEVRARIDGKVMEQHRPKDLFYQILHGLRTLTGYDHSGALLIYDEGTQSLELVAEQIAWRKGKSLVIGTKLKVTEKVRLLMETGQVFGFERSGGAWKEWSGHAEAQPLADALDYSRGIWEEGRERSEQALLCAPMASRAGVLGVLKVASCHPRSLWSYEADLVKRFLPQAAVALRNLRRAESLELGMLAAEKKHVMAELARGVSHDINNAVGSVLPLVQQLAAEARQGPLEQAVLVKDLDQIEEALKVCRRIFGGMLAFAKGGGRRVGDGDVGRAVESTLAVLDPSIRRHAVHVELAVEADLPTVRLSQGDLEQLLLNLATNARDAMPDGGLLTIRARVSDEGGLELSLEDTGHGIEAAHRARVHEPFFTTKRHGNGLGLSICRSIVWNAQGKLTLKSEPREGTLVTVLLPTSKGTPRPGSR